MKISIQNMTASAAILSLVVAGTTITASKASAQAVSSPAPDFVLVSTSTAPTIDTSPIAWPEIKASSAIVYDPVGNVLLYQKNSTDRHSMASLVKIMTAATVEEFITMNPKLAERTVKATSRLSANAADRSLINDSSWYPRALVNYMLVGSSNKAAESLASNIVPKAAFVSYMNFMAKNMGLANTQFFNETGLPIIDPKTKKESSAGITTAQEMAALIWNIAQQKPGLLDVTAAESLEFASKEGGKVIHIDNTNKLLEDLPIKFGKTGFTQLAGGNLAVVLQKNETSHPYIIVVLNSTEEDRFNDVKALADTTLANFTR